MVVKLDGGVSELVQEGALKASGPSGPCGFESHHRYQSERRASCDTGYGSLVSTSAIIELVVKKLQF